MEKRGKQKKEKKKEGSESVLGGDRFGVSCDFWPKDERRNDDDDDVHDGRRQPLHVVDPPTRRSYFLLA